MRSALVPIAVFLSATHAWAQQTHHLRDGSTELAYTVHEPATGVRDGFAPLVLLCGDGLGDATALLTAGGARVVVTADGTPGPLFAKLPAALRQQFAITRGGIHLVAAGADAAAGMQTAVAVPWEFQSVTLVGAEPRALTAREAARLRNRTVAFLQPGGGGIGPTLTAHLAAVRAQNEPTGAAGDVAHALDRFHDAAAKGDEDVYFALLPDDAVFLGTDATERWTGAEFRAFALPYFRRGPAWTYVPTRRTVTMLSPDTAMFDELLDNEAYGECRGSGLLERRDGRWVVRLYDLSIPTPNDLARAFVARIRAFAAAAPAPRGTIVIVRHAEKVADGSDDPGLTAAGEARAARLAAMLAELPVAGVFATEYRRTQATVAPLAAARDLTPRIVKAADAKVLARTLRGEFANATAVVAAHSNTIPRLLADLGVAGSLAIADDDYDDVFVVTLDADGSHLLRLTY